MNTAIQKPATDNFCDSFFSTLLNIIASQFSFVSLLIGIIFAYSIYYGTTQSNKPLIY